MSEKLNLVFDKKAIYWIKGKDLAAIVTAINQNRVTVPQNQADFTLTAHGEDGQSLRVVAVRDVTWDPTNGRIIVSYTGGKADTYIDASDCP